MRVLIVLTPLMCREAIAHSLSQHRPYLEVRIAAPEATEEELRSFAPHLLVHTDTDGLDRAALEEIRSQERPLFVGNIAWVWFSSIHAQMLSSLS